MTRRRKFLFALAAMAISATMTLAAVIAADLYVHHRAEKSAGLNRWGYRGPVAGRKRSGETRVVMLGGSTVFGYGGYWHEAMPNQLELALRARHPNTPISVINLGYNNEGAYAAKPTLEDYRYLDYDIVVLYEGYNDRGGDGAQNTQVYRRESPVFRLTGYSPILPLVLNERALMLRSGGLKNAYGDTKTVFRPNVAQRTSAAALETADAIGKMVGQQLDKLSAPPKAAEAQRGPAAPGADCGRPWTTFCESMIAATRYAREQHAKVLIVRPPISLAPDDRFRDIEVPQQLAVAAAVEKHFGSDPGVAIIDLSNAIDMSKYAFDEMHLLPEGNAKIAQLLEPAVAALAGLEH